MQTVFHMLICHANISFDDESVQNFCLFLNWVVCFLIAEFNVSLCILDTCLLSDMCFATYQRSLPVHGLVFHSLNTVFCRAVTLILMKFLMKSNLIFFPMDCASGI